MTSSLLNGVTRGLIIQEPWVSLLLSGKKTWELRKDRTLLRERVALIRQGTGLMVGVGTIVDSLEPLTRKRMFETIDQHQVPSEQIGGGPKGGWGGTWGVSALIFFKP